MNIFFYTRYSAPGTVRRSFKKTAHGIWFLAVVLGIGMSVEAQIVPSDRILVNTNGYSDDGGDFRPSIATDGAGSWVAVWRSDEDLDEDADGDDDIFVATSTNNGTTWSYPALLNNNGESDAGDDFRPDITTDGAGNWVAIWASDEDLRGVAGTDSDIFVATSTNNGLTWTDPALLNTNGTTDAGADFDPSIANDGNGNWVAIFRSTENLNGTAGTDMDIFAAASADNGATWSAPTLLNTNGTTDFRPDLNCDVASDGLGNWVAVWRSFTDLNGTAGLDLDNFVATSGDNGATWTDPMLLNTNGDSDSGEDFDAAVASDGNGTWIATWFSYENLGGTAGFDADILYTVSVDNGFTWSSPALLNANGETDSLDDLFPHIAADGEGSWIAVWRSQENLNGTAGTDTDIFFAASMDDGGTWTSPALLNTNGTTDGTADEKPKIAADGEGNWTTVWNSYEAVDGSGFSDSDIFAAKIVKPIHILSVPFYLDNAGNFDNDGVPADGTASFIAIANTSDSSVTLTISYTDTNGNDRTPMINTHVLAADSIVSWRPFADDPAEGPGTGQLVPNTDGGPAWGSVLIKADGPIAGRLIVLDGIQGSTAMMLLPEGRGSSKLFVPFYLDNASNYNGSTVPSDGTASFVGVKNMSNKPVTLTITYTDTIGVDHTPVSNTYVLPANSVVSWRPKADDPVEGAGTGQLVPNTDGGPAWGSVLIEADGPITGRLITVDGTNNSTGLMLLPEAPEE